MYLCTVKLREGGLHFSKEHILCIRFAPPLHPKLENTMSTIEELQKLREREDHVEFKKAEHNYPFAGGQKTDPKDRRHCVLGYVVALANEKGGRLVLGIIHQPTCLQSATTHQ